MAGYIGPIPVPQATQNRETFTATASQTSFATGGYQAGYLDVFMNGVKLVDGSDYTATNGSDVVLATGAAVNDILEVVSYSAFEVLNQNFTGTTVVDDLTVGGNLTVTGTTITLDHASAQTVDLGDNDKIRLGDGDDLQIYHDGSGSFIDDAGTGPLKIRTDNFVGIYNGDETETIATFADDGAVRLYFDNVERLTTTSTGIDVSGKFKTSSTGDAFNTTTSSHASGYAMDHYENSNDANNAWGAGRWHDGRYVISQKPSSATWASDATQRLVIDTSGNLLIGKTSADLSLTGIQATSSGQAFSVTRDGGAPFALNRKSSDGEIAGFYKDTVKVGGISVRSGDLTIHSTASGHEGLRLGNGAIVPTDNAGVSTDDACQLGSAGGRFSDIYLSGGVFLGGTTSSNKIDDYEEGTWTPATSVNGFTQSIASYSGAIYTKIGNVVRVRCRIHLSANGYASGYSRITGLPFSNAYNSAFGRYTSGAIGEGGNGGAIYVGSSDIYLFKTFGNTASGAHTYLWPLDFSYITNS